MDTIMMIGVVAILIEAISENIKWLIDGSFTRDKMIALIASEIIVLTTNISLFDVIGVGISYRVLGLILTGVILSRGANYLHDLMSKLNKSNGVK